MKYSILFSIFSVVVGLGFSNSAWAQNGSSGCGNAIICNVNGSGSGGYGAPYAAGQGPNGQQKDNGPTQAQCLALGNGDSGMAGCTQAGCNPYEVDNHSFCMSTAYHESCKGSFNSNGYCRASATDQVNNADVNSVTTAPAIQCKSDVDSAQAKCDPNKSQDVGAVMQMAGGLQQSLSMATGSSIQAACGSMGKISEMASAATLAYKGYCSYAYSECQKSCNAALGDPTAVQDKAAVQKLLKSCNGMTQNIADASNAVMGLVGAKLNMDQCKNLATDCTLNPTSAYCLAQADCTNTTVASTNLVCICQANPADSRCGAGTNTGLNGGFGSPTVASTGSTTDGSLGNLGLGDGGLGSITPPGAGTGTNQQPQNLAMGMQGGHNLGNTNGVNNAYQPPGAAGSKDGKASILSGYYGGSGSGGFGSGSGSSGNGNGGYGYGPGGAGAGKSGLDLKQFLPGGAKDPSRGIAGISGPDGITGPNSDIWQKVNTRYYSVSPSLLP